MTDPTQGLYNALTQLSAQVVELQRQVADLQRQKRTSAGAALANNAILIANANGQIVGATGGTIDGSTGVASLHGAPSDPNVALYVKGIGTGAGTRGLRVLDSASNVTLDLADTGDLYIKRSTTVKGSSRFEGSGDPFLPGSGPGIEVGYLSSSSIGGYVQMYDRGAGAYSGDLNLIGGGNVRIFPTGYVGAGAERVTINSLTNSWNAPTLTNSWVNYGLGFTPAGYTIDSDRYVHLRGLIKSGTMNTAAFTLPAGFRPTYPRIFGVASADAFGEVRVLTDGSVMPTTGSNAWFTLDNIHFSVF